MCCHSPHILNVRADFFYLKIDDCFYCLGAFKTGYHFSGADMAGNTGMIS